MMRFKLLASALAGTACYVLVSFVGGRDGLWAMEQLQEQKRILAANTAVIEKTNEELNLEKSALQKDMDVIAAYARKLGFIGRGEKLVKISGLAARETQIVDAGTVIRHKESRYIPERYCKGVGFIVFVLLYAVLWLVDYTRGEVHVHIRRSLYKRRAALQGMPVYDL